MSFLLTIYMVLSNCIRIVLEILLVVVCIIYIETDTRYRLPMTGVFIEIIY